MTNSIEPGWFDKRKKTDNVIEQNEIDKKTVEEMKLRIDKMIKKVKNNDRYLIHTITGNASNILGHYDLTDKTFPFLGNGFPEFTEHKSYIELGNTAEINFSNYREFDLNHFSVKDHELAKKIESLISDKKEISIAIYFFAEEGVALGSCRNVIMAKILKVVLLDNKGNVILEKLRT